MRHRTQGNMRHRTPGWRIVVALTIMTLLMQACKRAQPPASTSQLTPASTPSALPSATPLSSAAASFAKGKKLIQENCPGECGGSRQGMLEGLAEMQKALATGYEPQIEAQKLLAEGYNSLLGLVDGPDERDATQAKYRETVERMYQVAPNDPEVLEKYADLVEDKEERLKILERTTDLMPVRPLAQFKLSLMLIEKKEFDAGKKAAHVAILNADYYESAETYIGVVWRELRKSGCSTGEFKEAQLQALKAYEKGPQDPVISMEYRRVNLAMIDKVQCPQPAL